MKKLLIINTGGTFSSVESERGLKPGLSSGELLEAMRLVAGGIELEMEDLFLVDSANIFPDDWRRLAERIQEAAAGYQGIVVIHGTDTMAYTASMRTLGRTAAARCIWRPAAMEASFWPSTER